MFGISEYAKSVAALKEAGRVYQRAVISSKVMMKYSTYRIFLRWWKYRCETNESIFVFIHLADQYFQVRKKIWHFLTEATYFGSFSKFIINFLQWFANMSSLYGCISPFIRHWNCLLLSINLWFVEEPNFLFSCLYAV